MIPAAEPVLRRLSVPYSEILPAWRRKTAVLIAGGPSLTFDQVGAIEAARRAEPERVRVIAINDAYLWAPWADVLYFCDALWQHEHVKGVARPRLGLAAAEVAAKFEAFAGQRCSIEQQIKHLHDIRIHLLRDGGSVGLSSDPCALRTGRNSGFQAMNLALLAKASVVVMVGFDAKIPPQGQPTHWFGDHTRVAPTSAYEQYRRSFHDAQHAIAATGSRIINATPGSGITAFESLPLIEALGIRPPV